MPGSTAGPSAYYPTDDSRGKSGLVPLHPRPFETFRAKSARCGVCYLHRLSCIKFESFVCMTRNAFWHKLPSTSTKQARILWIPLLQKRNLQASKVLNFGSILARLFEAYFFSVLTMNWSCNCHP